MAHPRIFDRRSLLLLLALLLSAGFAATALFGYFASSRAIQKAIIEQDLPLTSSNIYSEIQKDLVRPVLISSTMAHDTFLRDWVLRGEKDVAEVARYLAEVKRRYGAFSSFFVSERSATYYTGEGILKRVRPDEPRDAWYFRVREMLEDYEINVDPDLANADALTIFINYRVFDFDGRFIGATGIGLTVDAVSRLVAEYQARFSRTIYFVDANGRAVQLGAGRGVPGADLRTVPGLGPLIDGILLKKRGSHIFNANGDSHILHFNYLPELKWYLFVEQNASAALADIRRTLYANLAISLVVTLLVVFLAHLALERYQYRIEEMATIDKLTGLLNRHAFTILFDKLLAEYRRDPRPISMLLADIDHFKEVNDRHGHQAGDAVLEEVARVLQNRLRASDMAVRWGGEEFLMVLKGCDLAEARRIAEDLREAVAQATVDAGRAHLSVTISLGVSQFDGNETIDSLVGRTDDALYAAKNGGRNRVVAA